MADIIKLRTREHLTPQLRPDLQTKRPAMMVAQIGARMHYAVPEIFQAAGCLDHFYTDVSAGAELQAISRLMPRTLQPQLFRRFVARTPRVERAKTTALNPFGLAYALRRAMCRSPTQETAIDLWAGRRFCEQIVAKGFGAAGAVYVFNSAGLEIEIAAHERGLGIILEQTIAPRRIGAEVIAREAQKFPGWEPPSAQDELTETFAAREQAEWHKADLILCGSSFVRDGIAACGGPVERCLVLPYGVDNTPAARRTIRPGGRLRVLSVGQVGLRKGSPYIAAAAKRMQRDAEFRLVGPVALAPAAQADMARHVTLTGSVPRAELHAHYRWADVFLLPSLHEGSATVVYEALAAGLPVICTHNTGSIVTDGREGFIIPVCDADAIVDRLTRLQDPGLRETMSKQALATALRGSVGAYGERLLAALQHLPV